MSYISLNMNLSFSMFPTFNLSRRNKYPKYVLCFSLTSIWIKHLFAKMNSYIGNLSVESCTRSLAHANMKCSIGKELSIYITPSCATVLKKTTPLKVDLVWSNCRRFIYHKEMNITNMTFAAPSLQLRSNIFFHSYEFEYRKPVLNRRSRSFFQTGTVSKKKSAIHSSYATTDDTIQILRMQKRWFERQCWCICLSLRKLFDAMQPGNIITIFKELILL